MVLNWVSMIAGARQICDKVANKIRCSPKPTPGAVIEWDPAGPGAKTAKDHCRLMAYLIPFYLFLFFLIISIAEASRSAALVPSPCACQTGLQTGMRPQQQRRIALAWVVLRAGCQFDPRLTRKAVTCFGTNRAALGQSFSLKTHRTGTVPNKKTRPCVSFVFPSTESES